MRQAEIVVIALVATLMVGCVERKHVLPSRDAGLDGTGTFDGGIGSKLDQAGSGLDLNAGDAPLDGVTGPADVSQGTEDVDGTPGTLDVGGGGAGGAIGTGAGGAGGMTGLGGAGGSSGAATGGSGGTGSVPTGCPVGKIPCNGTCIDSGACCADADCTGSCTTCDSSHACVALKGQDDPSGRCKGTCDATGTCKSRRGQPCDTVGGGCATGSVCSMDGSCCDTTCSDSCQACDVPGHEGTCTMLANNDTPHAKHTSCVTSDATCAGKCDGSHASCSYPAVACGTATCTSLVYQTVGTCDTGLCNKPSAKTCDHVCSVQDGGCTGTCTPDDKQCSALGVPQKCNASGAWIDQTACTNGFVCSSGDCGCPASKTNCTTACVDPQASADHCGRCNHSCLGGTCSSGLCQPAAMTGDLGYYAIVFGVDSNYVYFSVGSRAYRTPLTSTGGTGTLIVNDPNPENNYLGIVGSTVYWDWRGTTMYAAISGTPPTSGTSLLVAGTSSSNSIALPRGNAQYVAETVFQDSIYWITAGNTVASSWPMPTSTNNYNDIMPFVGYNHSVYWMHEELDASYGMIAGSGIFAVDADTKTKSQLCSLNSNFSAATINDVNAQSILLRDGATVYRVPNSSGTSLPVTVTSVVTSSGSNTFQGITEDSNGIYWFDAAGTVYTCKASNCSNTKVALATVQVNSWAGGLFQDSTALYFAGSGPFRIVRLAK